MKTDDLVVISATGAGIAPKHVAARRYTIALGWGMPISFALMLTTIGLLSDIKGALVLPGFWIKFGFVVSKSYSINLIHFISRDFFNIFFI